MFSFKSLDGRAQLPLVLDDRYSAGYLQVAEAQMQAVSDLSSSSTIVFGLHLF